MKALVVGGNSGIGISAVLNLLERKYDHIYIVGKDEPNLNVVPEYYKSDFESKVSFQKLNLTSEEYGIFNQIRDINTLIITAGFGRIAPFEELTETEITNIIKCNELSVIRIIKSYYDMIKSDKDFYCAVMGSIAGHVASPLFSVYGASKMGLCAFIENVNAELEAQVCVNRILDVSPGSVKGTSFYGGSTMLQELAELSDQIVSRMIKRETLYIPSYDEIYKSVIDRYHSDSKKFALESYEYKIKSGRMQGKPQVIVGYMSGTFDLFHIGHLNILKRAKEQCDYLVVGVHRDGSWKGKETFIPFEERVEIVRNIKYVDEVIESFTEDSDAYETVKYDKLFVGSDYKNSERFQRYEKLFKQMNVEIVYFPYTQGTSSTKLRSALNQYISKQM